ncbi:MAG: glycosyltransferase, partial [Pseudonocardiaceae bacterium]
VLRVTSVLRRTTLAAPPVLASALTLRAADLAAVVGLAALCVPTLAPRLAGGLAWGVTAAVVVALLGGLLWSSRLARGGAAIRVPSGWVALCVVLAWVLESAVVWEIARTAGHPLGVREALAVTAVTIVVQAVAVAPGGFGSYEAAATAALVALGVPAGPAFAIALTTHGAKTGYALLIGAVALVVPGPSYWGWLRLPPQRPPRPAVRDAPANAPVVVFLPAHDEQDTVGAVVAALPDRVGGRPVRVIVVDDGSTDGTAAAAAGAGALVVSQRRNLGLGAAVRRGLAEAVALGPAAVVYLDADGEYSSSDVGAVAAPVLGGVADYVVGSRFAGAIDRMLPHRRFGNRVLTAWVRWLARRRDITDGQSGFRAFSPAAAADAEVVHDYNYAQVLTLDLLGKGYSYAEVPIHYSFRTSGTSFVRLGRYLRRVLPAVHRELNKEWSLAARGAAGKRCAAPTPRPATSAGTPASTPTSS